MREVLQLGFRLPVLLHHLDEAIEQVRGVVRPGPGFRVILDGINWKASMPEVLG
jgi:hypothetical protein